jgi:hypothetical protein
MKLQRFGGYAAIASVLVAVAGLLLLSQLTKNVVGGVSDPSKFKDLFSTAPVGFYAAAVLMVIYTSLLQIMFIALNERMQNKAPQLTLISLIASSAGTVVMVAVSIFNYDTIRIALQHGVPEKIIEARLTFFGNFAELRMVASHFCGWAFLLMGWAILRVRPFSTLLGCLFVITGLLNILGFMLRYFEMAGHLCMFVASVWTGIALLRQKLPQSALEEIAVTK